MRDGASCGLGFSTMRSTLMIRSPSGLPRRRCRSAARGPPALPAPLTKMSALPGKRRPFASIPRARRPGRTSGRRPAAPRKARCRPAVARTARRAPGRASGAGAHRSNPCRRAASRAPGPAAHACAWLRVRSPVRRPCRSGLRWHACCDRSQRSCGGCRPRRLLPPRTGSAACRRWAAFPSAGPWWRAESACPGRPPGRRLC